MSTWDVEVRVTRSYRVQVEADNLAQALHRARETPAPERIEERTQILPIRERGPLVAELATASLPGAPGNLLLLNAPYQTRFSAGDEKMILHELQQLGHALGWEVVEHWNGSGCTQMTVRTSYPHDLPIDLINQRFAAVYRSAHEPHEAAT